MEIKIELRNGTVNGRIIVVKVIWETLEQFYIKRQNIYLDWSEQSIKIPFYFSLYMSIRYGRKENDDLMFKIFFFFSKLRNEEEENHEKSNQYEENLNHEPSVRRYTVEIPSQLALCAFHVRQCIFHVLIDSVQPTTY